MVTQQKWRSIINGCEVMRATPTGELKRAMLHDIVDEIDTGFSGNKQLARKFINIAVNAFLNVGTPDEDKPHGLS